MHPHHDHNHTPHLTRRWLLHRMGGAAGLILASGFFWESPAHAAPMASGDHAEFMEAAFEMKRRAERAGDQPYGAVVVKNGKIIGEGPSRVVTNMDPTAHAEMEAIRDAARRMKKRDLGGCILYASSRPCQMCETAAYWANIAKVYHGQGINDAGRPRYSSC